MTVTSECVDGSEPVRTPQKGCDCGVATKGLDGSSAGVIKDSDNVVSLTDAIAESLIPAKGRIKAPPPHYTGVVLSFDGAAKTSTRIGSCGCVLWQLPEWKVLDARGYILDDVTVNDAEYFGLLRDLAMARDRGIQDLVVVGDSRIVIQQVQGLINCNQPNLQRRLNRFNSVRLVHVKREFNQAADYLTSKTLALGKSWVVEEDAERRHLEVVSRIREQLMRTSDEETKLNSETPRDSPNVVTMGASREVALRGPECEPLPSAARVLAAFTRSSARAREGESVSPMGPLEYQAERWRRIKVHQEGDQHLSDIIAFLKDDLERFSPKRLKKIVKVADLFALDVRGVLYRLARSTRGRPRDAEDELRLVVSESLREDMLHYAHKDLKEDIRGSPTALGVLLAGMYADVERFVKECVDCGSGNVVKWI
ncbi:Hypothetical protein PHPALM_7131 [Phytophthora palmivora]|uniref:RNase H type-1 domain-containing protein n=1 Tax=Phytophthora palmivora TaxID=4796 RepID=A0A2P4YD33_9STRA|nr:Hypothetical protein PHPALM_7131 [Phytophthora palmivora]